ncbi:MAG: ThiF family adenylyltransferase [Gemmataceae bacterium]|nr:ThiF family adenylyltransferase [Gemmataceae bacterium]
MVTVFQVGVGSGGMAVLDAVARDPRIARVILLDPDTYQTHNVERHLFPRSDIGRAKVHLAKDWLADRRDDLEVTALPWDIDDPVRELELQQLACGADIGICAADNEPAKYRFDSLMRDADRPWTLGEVLSGGIGGLVHRFVPGGPCYGCVASYLKRDVTEAPAAPAPDYSAPGGPAPELRVPASRAAIAAVAGLHALVTLDMLDGAEPGFTTMLVSWKRVEGVFAEAYRPHKFAVPRSAACLHCQSFGPAVAREELDVALDQALERLGRE